MVKMTEKEKKDTQLQSAIKKMEKLGNYDKKDKETNKLVKKARQSDVKRKN